MALFKQGYSFIAGVDEVGRGCLAGPVVAAAVILPLHDPELENRLTGVRDSKQMTAQARDRLYDVIMQHALTTGIGIGSVELIDERNILQATKHAMYGALAQLSIQAQALLTRRLMLTSSAYFHNALLLRATRAASPSPPHQSSPKSRATA